MSRKSLLVITTSIFICIGVIYLSIVFASSLRPSARAEANRPHFNISELEIGTFQNLNTESDRYLVIKDYDSTLHVYWLPFRNDKVYLPDEMWFRAYYPCSNFGPEMNEERKIKKDGRIICHDTENFLPEHSWTYRGHNLGKYTEDMAPAKFRIDQSFLVILNP